MTGEDRVIGVEKMDMANRIAQVMSRVWTTLAFDVKWNIKTNGYEVWVVYENITWLSPTVENFMFFANGVWRLLQLEEEERKK